jgi:hypothetical protein
MTYIDKTLLEVGPSMSLGRFTSLEIVISQTMVHLETKKVKEFVIYNNSHVQLPVKLILLVVNPHPANVENMVSS